MTIFSKPQDYLQAIRGLFREDDAYASELYDHLKESVENFGELQAEHSAGRATDEKYYRQYCLLYRQLKEDAENYQSARPGKRWTDLGKARSRMCGKVLQVLEKFEPAASFYSRTGVEFPEEADVFQKTAAIAEVEGQAAADEEHGKLISLEEENSFVKKNRHLHKMLAPADDESFLRNYVRNRQTLARLIEIGENSADPDRQELARNAKIYERYFKYRMTLLRLPDTGRYREEREEAEYELKILADLGVKTAYVSKGKDAALLSEDDKGKELSLSKSALEGSVVLSHPSKLHVSAAGKFRAGKLGGKLKRKWVNLSASVSALKAAGSVDYVPTGTYGMNDVSTSSVAVGAVGVAYGAKARGKLTIGTKSNHIGFRGQFILGDAMAYGKIGAGMVKHEIDKENSQQQAGAEAKAGAEASIATLVYGGEISIFGIKLSLTNKVKIGAVGAHAHKEVSAGKIGFSLGVALGLGGDVDIVLDWSRAAEKIRKWWHHGKRVDREKTEEDIRKNLGADVQGERTATVSSAIADKASLGDESLGASVSYRRVLKTAENKMDALANAAAGKPADTAKDEAIASLVLVDLIRVQRQMNVAADKRMENAIHSSGQIKEVLDTLIRQNKGNKLWDRNSFTPGTKDAETVIRHVTSTILKKHERQMEQEERANSLDSIHLSQEKVY